MTDKIEVRQCDDWIEIKINGEIKYQGHSIRGVAMLDILNIVYDYEWVDDWYEGLDEWEAS